MQRTRIVGETLAEAIHERGVITIGAGMYDPGHAIRTDRSQVGFKIGEHDGNVTERAERLAKLMCDVAPSKVTTNLWGERWSKLSVNCMANGLAGLSGLGSAEVRTRDGVRRVAIHLAAETIKVGRARGHEVEPIWGITASASSTRQKGGRWPTWSATWRSGRRSWRAAGRRCSRT